MANLAPFILFIAGMGFMWVIEHKVWPYFKAKWNL